MVKGLLSEADCFKIGKVLNPKTNRCIKAIIAKKPKSPKKVAEPKVTKVKKSISLIKTISFFNNKILVFTGFRSKDLEKIIESNNGKVMGNISKKTDLLVIKDNNEMGEKIKKARLMNIKIITKGALEAIIKYGYKSSSRSLSRSTSRQSI